MLLLNSIDNKLNKDFIVRKCADDEGYMLSYVCGEIDISIIAFDNLEELLIWCDLNEILVDNCT